jgi:hypothetical protein
MLPARSDIESADSAPMPPRNRGSDTQPTGAAADGFPWCGTDHLEIDRMAIAIPCRCTPWLWP